MIISRQLEEGMTLMRGKESLKIRTIVRTGRSCTAVVKNSKGKIENLTITDMWNQKISIYNPDKKITVKKVKPPKKEKVEVNKTTLVVREAMKIVSKDVRAPLAVRQGLVPPIKNTEPLNKVEIQRGKGIATIYFKKNGTPLCTSWKRT